MTTTIKWTDNNNIETAHRIYKSSTYFDKDSLPAVLVELGPNITEWVDEAGADGENWYMVSALLNDYEVFSEPFIVGLSTVLTHDIFNDGSAVATYNFDGNTTDLGGNYDAYVVSGVEKYVPHIFNDGFSFDGSTELRADINLSFSSITYSFWATNLQADIQLLFEADVSAKLMLHTSSQGFRFGLIGTQYSNFSVDTSGVNHWIITWNGTTVSLYKNGNIIDTLSNPSSNPISTSFIRIGNRQSYYYTGTLDQVRIFNKSVNQDEVDILYQEGANFL